jgi:hypothetical protein
MQFMQKAEILQSLWKNYRNKVYSTMQTAVVVGTAC